MPELTFQPDYATPPGSTLKDLLDERGMSQSELAARTELTEKTISQISNGSAPITYETAVKLEMATGVPSAFWSAREAQYRSALLVREERSKLADMVDWLKSIPVRELIDRGYVSEIDEPGELVHEVLRFFAVASIEAWNEVWLKPQLQFRGSKAHGIRPGYVAAWVRICELAAIEIACEPYDQSKFRGAVQEIRAFTNFPAQQAIQQARELCAKCGVAIVLKKEIPKASVSGAAKWLAKDKAIIMLSLKYKTDDQFWFSFFHECGHIVLHGKRQVFVDDGMSEDSEEEREANKYARDLLIPPYHNHQLPHLKTKKDIRQFAGTIGVSPGIVVGRLQRDGFIGHGQCVDLKIKYEWA